MCLTYCYNTSLCLSLTYISLSLSLSLSHTHTHTHTPTGETALMTAVSLLNWKAALWLIKFGANVNVLKANGNGALMMTVCTCDEPGFGCERSSVRPSSILVEYSCFVFSFFFLFIFHLYSGGPEDPDFKHFCCSSCIPI